MYILSASASFDSAHFLKGYEGKCKNIHGHRWTIEAEVYSEVLIEAGETRGMVVDFKDIKKALKEIADSYDHKLVYEEGTLSEVLVDQLVLHGFDLYSVPFRPTAECLSKCIFDTLKQKGHSVLSVSVFETPTNKAVYREKNAE